MRENDNDNNLFFVCSIIEYIARETKNTKEYIVKKLGKENINKILRTTILLLFRNNY